MCLCGGVSAFVGGVLLVMLVVVRVGVGVVVVVVG